MTDQKFNELAKAVLDAWAAEPGVAGAGAAWRRRFSVGLVLHSAVASALESAYVEGHEIGMTEGYGRGFDQGMRRAGDLAVRAIESAFNRPLSRNEVK